MTNKCRMLNAECGMNAAALCCARHKHPASSNQHPVPPRPALTLIELLVTIVIMVTVLAGVLPLVSPNNNSRKLREASRQLNSLLAQAQAQAARDGRPVGVAFRETGTSAPYSGMALEAYMIAEPQPFAGFSEHSRVTVDDSFQLCYGPNAVAGRTPNEGSRFSPRLNGLPVCRLTLYASGNPDSFPPRTLRIGDTIAVAGNLFLICDDADNTAMPNQIDENMPGGVEYLLSDPQGSTPIPGTTLDGVWLNYQGQQLPQMTTPPSGQSYAIRRQPMNTSETPLQFPRGIGIDMDASGATGVGPAMPLDFDVGGQTIVGIMFSPNGSIDTVYRDGVRREGVEQVYMLIGLVENGNNGSQDFNDYDFSAGSSIADDELVQRRSRLNWLLADSRWVSVNRAGRIITAENNVSFDPRQSPYIDSLTGTPEEKAREQRRRHILGVFGNGSGTIYSAPDSYTRADSRLEAFGARLYAQQMSGSTGR